jgi:hypothetical protein
MQKNGLVSIDTQNARLRVVSRDSTKQQQQQHQAQHLTSSAAAAPIAAQAAMGPEGELKLSVWFVLASQTEQGRQQ